MSDIIVNKLIWDAISEADKRHIAAHLEQYGVLKPGQKIVADSHAPLPSVKPHINDTSGDNEVAEAMGIDWTCRAICDLTKAEANCSLYGQPLSACLKTISQSRESFSDIVE